MQLILEGLYTKYIIYTINTDYNYNIKILTDLINYILHKIIKRKSDGDLNLV